MNENENETAIRSDVISFQLFKSGTVEIIISIFAR